MSLIFDALQRAEAERSGVDLSELNAVTEVLQRAELHAVSTRKTVASRSAASAQIGEIDTSLPSGAVALNATVTESLGSAELSPNVDYSDVFRQFPSQKVIIPSENRLVTLTDGENLAAENFRFLGIRLQHFRRERALKKLLITSTIPQEGKSFISANLSCSLARKTQQKVLLVEGDVRRPALSQMFGIEKIPGICECLQGERDVMKSVYHLEEAGLWFLPAGNTPKNPLELLQTAKLSAMMNPLATWFDWIIIDSPPVMPLADTSLWMRMADGVLLVVRQGTTVKRQLERGLEALEGNKLVAAVLNGAKRKTDSDYYYTKPPSTTSRPD
jgi:capsular exopolysaccharide synthesis family protein